MSKSERKLTPHEQMPPSFEGSTIFPYAMTVVVTAIGLAAALFLVKIDAEAMAKEFVQKFIQPTDLGLSIIAILFHLKTIMWMGACAVRARSNYGVPWPNLYATKEMTNKHNEYNCVQRAHQQSLEGIAAYIVFQICAAQQAPFVAGLLGIAHGISRVMYGLGYQSGKPTGRLAGAWGFLVMFPLEGLATIWALKQIGITIPI